MTTPTAESQPTGSRAKTSFRDIASRVASLDPRSLALFRITIALVVLSDLYFRSLDLSFFYSDAGVLPRSFILAGTQLWDVSLHLMSGMWQIQAALFGVTALAGLALLFGYRTPQATIWTWILVMSLQRRNPLVDQGGDIMLRVVLFWAMFLPLNLVWSLDARRREKVSPHGGFKLSAVASIATICFIGQLIVLYFFAAIQKTGNQWLVDRTAVFYTLSVDQFTTPLGHWLLQFPELLRFLTTATLVLELCVPLLLLSPLATGPIRLAVCALFAAFHGGLALTLELGPFPYVALASWSALLPGLFWDFFRVRPEVSPQPQSFGPHGRIFRAARATLLCFVFAHVLVWNLRTIDRKKWTTFYPAEYDYVLTLLGLDQNWGMFAPYPITGDGWFKISARTVSGRIVNLTPGASPDDPLTDERPKEIRKMYSTERWRKYLMSLVWPINAMWRPLFIRALALRWAEEHPDDRLVRVDVDFFQEIMLPWCVSTPAEKIHLAHSDSPETGI